MLCALKLSKPTLSVGYAAKHDVLMRDMDMTDFCEPARSLDLDRLIAKFVALERDRDGLVATLDEHNAEKVRLLDEQFVALWRLVAAPSDQAVDMPAAHTSHSTRIRSRIGGHSRSVVGSVCRCRATGRARH